MAEGGAQALGSIGDLCSLVPCTSTFAPLILGVVVSAIALGSLVMLAIRCWTSCAGSRWRARRVTVLVTLLLQILQTFLDILRLILVFATHYGQVDYFIRPRWEDAAAPFVGVVLQLQAQLFLLDRAFRYASVARVSQPVKWTVTILVGLAIFGGAAMGMGVSLEIYVLGSLIYLIPGSPHSPLYNRMVLIWLYTGAAVDLILVSAIVNELLAAKRVAQGSIKSKKTRQVMRRMISVLFDAGIVLFLVQAGTAIAWQVETANSDGRQEGSWIYAVALCLPKVYTFTYYLMLLSTAEPSPPASLRNSLEFRGAVGINLVETVEYSWGKGKDSGSTPSSNEGIITVTGLPLDALPYALQPTYQAPFPEPGEDGGSPSRSLRSGHRRRTSAHDRTTPPSSPTRPFLGLSNRPVVHSNFPAAPQLALPRSPPRPFKLSTSSRSPPRSPLRSNFRMPRNEVPDDVIAEESEEGHEAPPMPSSRASALMAIVGEDEQDDERTLASCRFGSEQRGSSFINLGTASIAPSSSSTAFSQVSDSISSASRKGSAASGASSADTGGGRKESDASWACVDAKTLTHSKHGRP